MKLISGHLVRAIALAVISIICGSCSLNNVTTRTPSAYSRERINNLHVGDPALAGIHITQWPTSPEDARGFSNESHPAEIEYFFWDGRTHAVEYSSSGKVLGDVWSDAAVNSENTNSLNFWEGVDFSYGSDPLLKHHPNNPRARQQMNLRSNQ